MLVTTAAVAAAPATAPSKQGPLHICHVALALKGGPLTLISDWIREQVRLGHRVSLVYSPLRDDVTEIQAVIPADVLLIPLAVSREVRPERDVRSVAALRRVLAGLRPDIIHNHCAKAGLVGRLTGRLMGIPTIYSPQGLAYLQRDVSWFSRALYFGVEWFLGRVGTMTVASSATELLHLRGVPGRKGMIPNGISLADFQDVVPAARSGRFRVVLCGRLSAQKNPAMAAAIAAAAPADWEWLWIGDGELRAEAEASGRIQVLGWLGRQEVLSLVASADVLLHMSLWEGMPMAILEAMALGRPVVASDVVGNKDLVVPGRTGFLVETVEDSVRAMTALAGSDALRRQMGDAGRAEVARTFDQSFLIRRWIDLYRDLIGHRTATQ